MLSTCSTTFRKRLSSDRKAVAGGPGLREPFCELLAPARCSAAAAEFARGDPQPGGRARRRTRLPPRLSSAPHDEPVVRLVDRATDERGRVAAVVAVEGEHDAGAVRHLACGSVRARHSPAGRNADSPAA